MNATLVGLLSISFFLLILGRVGTSMILSDNFYFCPQQSLGGGLSSEEVNNNARAKTDKGWSNLKGDEYTNWWQSNDECLMDKVNTELPLNVKSIPLNYKYYVVALLKDNESIMRNWTVQLLCLVNFLGKDSVYVSILENGDSKDETPRILQSFKKKLDELKVPKSIITERKVTKGKKDRIEFLAELRNFALKPLLYSNLDDWRNPEKIRIIFLNDIWYKAIDILQLIATNNGEYDIACGLDFYFTFYDTWVTRDLRGKGLWPSYPYFYDTSARNQLKRGAPVRVFSCWNGAAIIQAKPFLESFIRFRSSNDSQPYHSECFWICYDFWSVGFTRVLINPKVIVTYNKWHYYLQKFIYKIVINPVTSYLFWLKNNNILDDPESIPSSSSTRGNVPALAINWKDYL